LNVVLNRSNIRERLANRLGRLNAVRGNPRGRRERDGEHLVESVFKERERVRENKDVRAFSNLDIRKQNKKKKKIKTRKQKNENENE